MTNPETNTPEQKTSVSEEKKLMSNRNIVAFALEFGFMIVLPLLIFTLAGKWLAHRFDNQAYFFGGIILALVTSVAWFWKRITDIYNDFIK